MKSKKLLSLILAVLMVASALPLVWLGAYAEEPITAPTTLPDGSTYLSEVLFKDSYNMYATNGSWMEASEVGANASATLRAGVYGVMFKVDATQSTAAVDTLAMTFTLQLKWDGGSTYLAPTPNGAAIHSGGKTSVPADASSTWYYSLDGERWESMTFTGRYTENMPIGKNVAYIYIPISDFWTKDGATVLGGGTQSAAQEDCVDFAEFESIVGKTYTLSQSKFWWGGSNGLGGDSKVNFYDFKLVYEGDPNAEPEDPGQMATDAPTKLPSGSVYTPYAINNGFVITGDGDKAFSRWQGADMRITATQDKWITADGIMFKFDTSNVPATNQEIMGLALQFTAGSGKIYQSGDADGAPSGSASGYYFVSAGLLRYHNTGSYTYNGAVAKETGLTSTWYLSTDGKTWETITENVKEARCAYITNKHTVGYIFVPFESMWCVGPDGKGLGGYNKAGTFADGVAAIKASGGSLNASNFGLCLQSASDGATQNLAIQTQTTFSGFSFVYNGIHDFSGSDGSSSVTPPPAEYDTIPINEGFTFSGNNSNTFSYWIGQDMGISGVGSAWLGANGLMFKFDTSNAPEENREMMGLALQMSAGSMKAYRGTDTAGSPTGSSTGLYFVTAGLLRYHASGESKYQGKLAKELGLTSTWYYTTDNGKTWETVVEDVSQARCGIFTNQHTVGYIYLPFESLWCMGPGGNGLFAYREIGTFADGVNAMAENGKYSLSNFGLCLNSGNSGANQNLAILSETQYSDFKFVKFDASAIKGTSITLKDTLSFNVYAKLPWDYAGTVTFTIGDRTVQAVGELMSDGFVRFTLPDILPADAAKQITAVLHATSGDDTIEKTLTSSIEAYCKKVLAENKRAAWHEATKALLHYCAAEQTKVGVTGTLCNDGIDEVATPVNMETLEGTYQNGSTSIWGNATALAQDGKLQIKLAVTAPANIGYVQYAVGNRLGTVVIKDGYALISLHAYEVMEDVTVKCFDTEANKGNGDVTSDPALVISMSWTMLSEQDAAVRAFWQTVLNLANETAAIQQ